MINKECFKIWAPNNSKWSKWTKPVLFISIDNETEGHCHDLAIEEDIMCLDQMQRDTAIIVDRADDEGIKEGLGYAKKGYRPVVLYNGTVAQKGAIATVDTINIQKGLVAGSKELKNIELNNEAPPVFLLDTNRLNRYKMNESVFDNSWDIYAQDFPTATYFLENGINKIIVVSNKLEKDLKKILYKFQKKGIDIYFSKGDKEYKEIKIRGLFLKEEL